MRASPTWAGLGLALAAGWAAAPAYAHPDHAIGHPGWHDAPAGYGYGYAPAPRASFPVDRALAERCGLRAGSMRPHLAPVGWHEPRHRDDGLGGALIGGVVGNRIAGPGDRTVGTIAGAAVGAVAGAAIDRAEDDDRRRPGYDWPEPRWEAEAAIPGECDAVLPPGYVLVAVSGGQECHDEVITREEWVPETVTIPARPAPRPRDKRTKLRRIK